MIYIYIYIIYIYNILQFIYACINNMHCIYASIYRYIHACIISILQFTKSL